MRHMIFISQLNEVRSRIENQYSTLRVPLGLDLASV